MNPDVEAIINELEQARAEVEALRAENHDLREAAQMGILIVERMETLYRKGVSYNRVELLAELAGAKKDILKYARAEG